MGERMTDFQFDLWQDVVEGARGSNGVEVAAESERAYWREKTFSLTQQLARTETTLTRERDEAVARQKLAEQALGLEMRGRTSLVQMIHDAHHAKQAWLTSSEMIELVAAWDHQAWASWTTWMLDRLTPENIERWRRQIATPYADLSEGEKESDRREAREVLAIILNALVPQHDGCGHSGDAQATLAATGEKP